MNTEQASAAGEVLTALWELEFPATARVLSAVKDDTRDYTPHPKSRTAWDLATHIAMADIWFIDSIVAGHFQWNPDAAKQAQEKFRGIGDVVRFYEDAFPARLAKLRALSGAELAESLDFFGRMQMSRAQWIGFATHHSVHHRGQLSAYLRALGSRVPDIYGPSADAEPVTA